MTSDGAFAVLVVSIFGAMAVWIGTDNWMKIEAARAYAACVQTVKDRPADDIKKICGEKRWA